MPYKYIGRTTSFSGKPLWEIIGNLKNFGVGRLVTRNIFARYPEVCFLKILKVETLPDQDTPGYNRVRKVRVIVESTFRGKTFLNPVQMESTTYKDDYRLIPKDQEAKYYAGVQKTEEKSQEKILPRFMGFPPLLQELIIRDCMNTKGRVDPEDLKLEIQYNCGSKARKYKIAQEDEEPTEKMDYSLGTPVTPRLYEGVKF